MKSQIFLLAIVLGINNIGHADAQSIFLDPIEEKTVHLEFLVPNIPDVDLTLDSYTMFLSGRFRMSNSVFFEMDLPVSSYQVKDPPESGALSDYGSQTVIGNPYIGLEFASPGSPWRGDIGFRFGIVNELTTSSYLGNWADPIERFGAFVPESTTYSIGTSYRRNKPIGMGYQFRLASELISYSYGANFNQDPQFHWYYDRSDDQLQFVYSVHVWYQGANYAINGGLIGRVWAPRIMEIYGKSTHSQFGFSVTTTLGKFKPGIQIKVPISNELSHYTGTSFGLSLSLKL